MKQNPLLVSCREATLLVEKKLQGQLTIKERVQLVVHTAICQACRGYQQQSGIIERALRAHFTPDGKVNQSDTGKLEERIIRLLEDGDATASLD
ncbi:MAG: hypothetical protein KDC57_07100 [Saprospiraceae bacterium]|nr:hypothetical protein [Saprospiraceae bacterium]